MLARVRSTAKQSSARGGRERGGFWDRRRVAIPARGTRGYAEKVAEGDSG